MLEPSEAGQLLSSEKYDDFELSTPASFKHSCCVGKGRQVLLKHMHIVIHIDLYLCLSVNEKTRIKPSEDFMNVSVIAWNSS